MSATKHRRLVVRDEGRELVFRNAQLSAKLIEPGYDLVQPGGKQVT
jgi:hypothetical protein